MHVLAIVRIHGDDRPEWDCPTVRQEVHRAWPSAWRQQWVIGQLKRLHKRFTIIPILVQVQRMIPIWHWTLQSKRDNIFVFLMSRASKFRFNSTSSYKPFWEKCTEWPQNDLEYRKVKRTPYMCCYGVPKSKIVVCFALWLTVLELHAILKQVHRMTPKWRLQNDKCDRFSKPKQSIRKNTT